VKKERDNQKSQTMIWHIKRWYQSIRICGTNKLESSEKDSLTVEIFLKYY